VANRKRITITQKDAYWKHRGNGESMATSAAAADFSLPTAQRLEAQRKNQAQYNGGIAEQTRIANTPDPMVFPELSDEAKRALEDFGYFQRRYLGRIAYHWQVEAAHTVLELLESPHKEFLVVNAPPGSGKTTLFTHDIPAWLTVRNRAIRGMMGAATTALASRYTNRLRRTLARTLPEKASDDDLVRGLALDAETTLAADFGRFQAIGDSWTADAFVVQQLTGTITEKEPTWSAYGQDAGFIGGRFNFVVWDDLVDPKKQKTIEAKEDLQNYWDSVSEPRLEPEGLLILQGQRLSSDDLYRYCLDKEVGDDVDFQTGELVGATKKYHHILYKAHYDENCKPPGTHAKDAPNYPEGCLLDTRRLPWRELSSIMRNREDMYQVVYQQQDSDPQGVLVHPDWIDGRNGSPGCLDDWRDRLELPKSPDGGYSLQPPLISVMTVDPSPSKYWAIQWWVYQPATEFRWLMDMHRSQLAADEFLDFDYNHHVYSGILDEWVQTSVSLNLPITHVIVETNAAQKFLLQYDHVRRWMALRGVEIISHDTHRNKSDEEFGVWSIRQHYRFGRIRLPWKRNSQGFIMSRLLRSEVTTYPHGRTDDIVMAHWFLEWNLPRIYSPDEVAGNTWVPSWAGSVPDLRKPGGVESRRVFQGA
jgi:hypothetical protein